MAKSKNQTSKNAKAAAKVRAAQQQKRQRMQWSIGIIVLVVVGITVLVLAKMTKSDTEATSTAAQPAPASISEDLAAVPMDAIAAAYAANPPNASSNPVQPNPEGVVRESAGKPEVLYIGAEFCPYCAGERWALNVALAKFGSFSDLQMLSSSEADVPTLSYVGSSFTSDHVAFKPIELQDQEHKSLETATDAEMELFQTLGGGAFPFIDFGGTAFQKGGSVDIQVLLGKSQAEIASELAASTADDTDPNSIPGNVNAVAGEFIRTICDQTDNQPAKVCNAIPAA